MTSFSKFDLGGLGRGGERRTVNIHAECDIEADFTELDAFCEDGTVEEFYMSHALEHVPSGRYADFLCGLWRKLKPGGVVRVAQSDIALTLRLWQQGRLSFRAMRTVVFPPADRLRQNPYHQHFNMWGARELAEDFRVCGFHPVELIDAGAWPLDHTDDLHPGAVESYHGLMIPNLGVAAYKPIGDIPDAPTPPRTPPSLRRPAGSFPLVLAAWRSSVVPLESRRLPKGAFPLLDRAARG